MQEGGWYRRVCRGTSIAGTVPVSDQACLAAWPRTLCFQSSWAPLGPNGLRGYYITLQPTADNVGDTRHFADSEASPSLCPPLPKYIPPVQNTSLPSKIHPSRPKYIPPASEFKAGFQPNFAGRRDILQGRRHWQWPAPARIIISNHRTIFSSYLYKRPTLVINAS